MKLIACTLSASGLAERQARWQALAARALAARALADVEMTDSGLRLRFTGEPDELAELAELERDCCGFATWRVDGTTLQVDGATPEAVSAVQAMFSSLR